MKKKTCWMPATWLSYIYIYIYIYIIFPHSPLLTSCSLYTKAMSILIFIWCSIFRECCFYTLKKVHMIKCTPLQFSTTSYKKISSQQNLPFPPPLALFGKPWPVIYSGFFGHTIDYTRSACMLNTDGHKRYRFFMF